MAHHNSRRARWLVGLAALAVLAPAAEGAGRCISAEISEAVALPDGSIHEPGRMQICLTQDLTPTISLHRASVDGVAAQFYGRRSKSEGHAERSPEYSPYIRFVRNRAGVLVLEGYGVPERGHYANYRIQMIRKGKLPDERTLAGLEPTPDAEITLVAASLN